MLIKLLKSFCLTLWINMEIFSSTKTIKIRKELTYMFLCSLSYFLDYNQKEFSSWNMWWWHKQNPHGFRSGCVTSRFLNLPRCCWRHLIMKKHCESWFSSIKKYHADFRYTQSIYSNIQWGQKWTFRGCLVEHEIKHKW